MFPLTTVFSRKSSQGGYALGVTVVFVAVAVTIAVGLAVGRQMGGQMGEKQLHRIITQTALDVDSMAMLAALRQSWEEADEDPKRDLIVSSDSDEFKTKTTFSISPLSSSPGGNSVVYTSSSKVVTSREGSQNGRLKLGSEIFYDQLNVKEEPCSLGMWDPYRNIWSKRTVFGVLTTNELVGGARENKDVRTVRNAKGEWVSGSRLHAWMEMDTAKVHEIVVRRLPASAFTLFVPAARVFETLVLGTWVNGEDNSHKIGRYYTETAFVPGRRDLILDLPLVAAGGVDWGKLGYYATQSSMCLEVPSNSTVGEDSRRVYDVFGQADSKSFYKNRYTKYGGLISTGVDRPVGFRRFGGYNATLRGKISDSDDNNILAKLKERANVILRREDGEKVSVSSGENYLFDWSNIVSVNDSDKEIILDFTSCNGSNFSSVSELILYVTSGGKDRYGNLLSEEDIKSYKVRVILPNMEKLGFNTSSSSHVGGLTIVTRHPVIFEGDFNSHGSRVPVMVAAENFVASCNPGQSVAWYGVFLTSGGRLGGDGNPFKGFVQGYPEKVPSSVSVHGSVIFWERNDNKPLVNVGGEEWPLVPVNLHSDGLYLDGSHYPPGTPALVDLRFGRELLQTYVIHSEEAAFTPVNSDDGGSS